MTCPACGDAGPHPVVEQECRERKGWPYMEAGIFGQYRVKIWTQKAVQCGCGFTWADEALRKINSQRYKDARKVTV